MPAGLPEMIWLTFFPYDSDAGKDRERMAREALILKPAAKPGEKYLYSNLGYVVAGYMLEKLTGRDWETLIREEIFLPLAMESAGFGPPAAISPQSGNENAPITAPWGHAPEPVPPDYKYADNPAALGPAGTVHASLMDLEKYIALFWNKGRTTDGKQILSESSMEEILTPRLNNYALG